MASHRSSESRTENVARELLAIRGWKSARPPKGNILWKNEYRDYPDLLATLKGAGKLRHGGDGYPDFLVIDPESRVPLIVGETKANDSQIGIAVSEAMQYGNAFVDRGFKILTAGIAGDDQGNIAVQVHKLAARGWRPISYRGDPIQWLPTPEETGRLLVDDSLFDLQPRVPSPEVLAERGDEINRTLRECKIKDELRPAIMGAFMLALWESKGSIRMDAAHVLHDINNSCKQAFKRAEKPEIAESIAVPVDNHKLAARASNICHILRLLNVTNLTAEHDYLGQLYETFFRFTGGNTIGQFFTPRHITEFMTKLCDVSSQDMVVDPTCGTGGFLIAALDRMLKGKHLTSSQMNQMVKSHLRGFETEPITAALCVANMILRGDGKTGIVKQDCFTSPAYPVQEATVVLGNPPFPHKKTEEPAEKFVDRGLEALKARGKLAMIVPGSLLAKSTKAKWRLRILRENSLLAVITLPSELFQPYASSTTAIVILEKGIPQRQDTKTLFCHVENDGLKLKKNTRVPQPGEQLSLALEAYRDHRSIEGFATWATIPRNGLEWSPGAYIATAAHKVETVKDQVDWLIRSLVAFHAQHAPQLERFRKFLGQLENVKPYQSLVNRKAKPQDKHGHETLGALFDIYYGQKELHSKERLASGPSMVVSSSGVDNGCYGFFDFEKLIAPPFVTVPSTGSIGEAFVQMWPCGVTDDCLILVPKPGTTLEDLFIAAAVLRLEKWRFNYGRKATPARIAHMKAGRDDVLKTEIRGAYRRAKGIIIEAQHALSSSTNLRDEVRGLAKQWREETGHLSSVERKVLHAAYQRIIALGMAAVPYVLEELEARNGHWFWALHFMTGKNQAEDSSVISEARAAWLAWGESEGYL